LDTVYGKHRKLLILLPGPPPELKAMFDEQCLPKLREIVPERFIVTRTLKAAMLPESQLDARIAPIYGRYQDVETTILAHTGDLTIHLSARKPRVDAARMRVDELAGKIEEELDDCVYSSQNESLEQIVLDYLGMRGATLAVAESCTGGMVSERLTRVSGSSRSFLGGAVVYSNRLKTVFAGVPNSIIESHGAVSREVAAALAEGILRHTSATFGVGITGIAGPGGGTEEKPTDVLERRFGGDRDSVRAWASQLALDMIRRRLM
jgi:nicotinamide-nucleotide amidase